METMGALQPVFLSPVAMHKGYYFIVIDLKNCFFIIEMDASDCYHFAFSVPSPNLKRPYQIYHWAVLPQEIKMFQSVSKFC